MRVWCIGLYPCLLLPQISSMSVTMSPSSEIPPSRTASPRPRSLLVARPPHCLMLIACCLFNRIATVTHTYALHCAIRHSQIERRARTDERGSRENNDESTVLYGGNIECMSIMRQFALIDNVRHVQCPILRAAVAAPSSVCARADSMRSRRSIACRGS
jgi:hypothetical protein